MKRIFSVDINKSQLDVGLLLLRVIVGLSMLTHGIPKFYRLMEDQVQFADPIGLGSEATLWLAVMAEVACSTFILIGLATRLAVVLLICTMVVVIFIVQWDNPFSDKELPILYLASYIMLMICGSGKYSVDYLLNARITSRK